MGLTAIDGGEIPSSVVLPQDLAILGRVGAHAAIHRARKNDTGNCGHRRRVGGFAVFAITARRVRGTPDRVSIAEPDCSHPAACVAVFRIEESIRHVDSLVIDGDAPQDAATRTPFADPLFPNGFALMVRVEGPDHSRLVSGDQYLAPAWQFSQNRRGAEIEVGCIRVRTDGRFAIRTAATRVPDVLFGFLANPLYLASRHVHGHDRIGKTGGWWRGVIAGTQLKPFSLQPHGVIIPD